MSRSYAYDYAWTGKSRRASRKKRVAKPGVEKRKKRKKRVAKPGVEKRKKRKKPARKKPAIRKSARKQGAARKPARRKARPAKERVAKRSAPQSPPDSGASAADRKLSADDARTDYVIDEIQSVPASGRFGSNKVFISALWGRVKSRIGMSLPEFKHWLIIKLREGKIILARADLIGAMPVDLVVNSETEDRGATFHFVLDLTK